jgi:HNH endonuclease
MRPMQDLPISQHIKICEHGDGCDACCWEWAEEKRCNGYGLTKAKCFGYIERYAHRVVWMHHHQQRIPKGVKILRTCNNTLCCNPLHLVLSIQKGKLPPRTPFNSRKLTKEQVLTIFKMAKTGSNQRKIAEYMGVTPSLISQILGRRIWRHLTPEGDADDK